MRHGRTVGAIGLLTAALMLTVFDSHASADGDCSDNRLVQLGRLPDIIFPAGRAACVVIPPELLKVKSIADTSVGNCGLCIHVRTGSPHVGVANDALQKASCVSTNFAVATPGELTSTVGVPESVRNWNGGFTIFSDGTPGSGTIEVTSRDGFEFHNSCDPAQRPGQYVIGTFNYFVTSSGVTDTAFTHVVSVANNPVPSRTVLGHALLDGVADARPILMSVWNHGSNPGVDNNHPVGLAYGVDVSDRWSIVALDGGALPLGAQFNVEVAPHSDTDEFVAPFVPTYRRAIAAPSFADHDSQALLFPAGGGNQPNSASTVGSAFNSVSGTWSLANMNGATPNYVNFFVRFIGASATYPSLYAQRVQSDSSNTVWESLLLGNPIGLNAFSRIFVSPIWAPGSGPSPYPPDGPEVAAPLGVWWTGDQWALWRQDWDAIPTGAGFNVYWHRPAIVANRTPGSSNGDKYADIMLLGGNLSAMPIATATGDGHTFDAPTAGSDANFLYWAQFARPISGDFDGDGRNDVALTGGPGWSTIPVAFSMGDGAFQVTNGIVDIDDSTLKTPAPQTLPALAPLYGDANFPSYAGQAGANPVGGDFNGDGLTDIALFTVPGISTIPIAFSRGDGTFFGLKRGVETGDTNFTSYAAQGAKVVVGDFNGDGKADVALTGGSGWTTVPVAFSNGNGAFNATNLGLSTFPSIASQPGARALAGDFDGDGKTDIAIYGHGGSSWCGDVEIAFSNGDGTFHRANVGCYTFWGAAAKTFTGDFDADGKTDIGVIANFTDSYGVTWHSLDVLRSNGDASFTRYNSEETGTDEGASFLSMAGMSAATALSGSESVPFRRNLALGQTASQSTDPFGAPASLAVDGNPDGDWYHGSITHTDYEFQPWWQVDLGANKFVSSVDVFNRTDCCAERLTDYNILTSTDGSSWTTIAHNNGQGGTPGTLVVNAQARFVRVQLNGTNYLSLAEVYVWGF